MQNLIQTVNPQTRPSATPTSVIGPEGQRITRESLPPANTKRWVIRRKAEVVAAVRGGLLTLEEACERYILTIEEFQSWQRAIEQHGLPGLRATRLQDYRPGMLKDTPARSL
ncbi:MAG: DUF1153 domain-containing protein [Ferrovibrio sp.]|uniref:CtrA inhibitor SciP n=1 Tax=Ferrovibrio sp. TaxID=1917215 RepID=UPI002603886E|nr:DUF1153 domain-containing protein [Ferrovibrio sp.]MCW0235626.1 DUF1153 domain-containing protein [Ferrovibrio sp.]